MAITPILGAGSEVGPYRIETLLGQGGMGVVYRARDPRLDRLVALKLLSPELSHDQRFRARFERESRLAASIDHGGIVPIYEAGDADGLLYIAMRYVEGSDLAQLLRQEGPLEPARALDLVGQLADALDAAHTRGLIHRDVKPSNALVGREGSRERVYLADFGLTKTSGAESVTASAQVMGTVAYMAPEVIRGDEPRASADLYALGCVLFECLTGEVPFPGTNAAAVIYGHLETPPPRVRDRAPGLPAALDGVLARSLAKDPGERFESGAAMMDAARAALGGAAASRRIRRPPWRFVAGAVAIVAVVAVAALVLRPKGDDRVAAIRTDALALIDPGDRSLRAQVALDGPPSAVAVAPGAVWVAGDRDGTVSRVDAATHTVRQTVTVGHGPSALAADRGGVWVANRQDGTLSRISAATNAIVDTIPAGSPSGVCLLDGDVWVAGATAGAVLRIDPGTRRPREVATGVNALGIACGDGALWVVGDNGQLAQISPATNSVLRTVDVGAGASTVAYGEGGAWVANLINGTVSRVDPQRGVVTATVSLGADAEPVALATGGGAVWVADRHSQMLDRIDPARAALVQRLPLGNEPSAVAVVDGRLWAAVSATGAGHRGGTVRADFGGKIARLDLDPATGYDPDAWQILSMTNDGLTGFRRVGGTAGATLVPDLAEALPTPSDAGRTYTFTVRRGVTFSTGQPVRPSDVRRGLERSMHAKQHAYGLLSGIASITADDPNRTIVIRLKRPDPDFLDRVALPFGYAVPPGTGPAPRIVAATGPYRIAAVKSGRRIRIDRNPHYRGWPSLARPDGYADVIDVRMQVKPRKAVDDIRTGRADWTSMAYEPGRLAALRRDDPGLLREIVFPQTAWWWLNTRVPPFDHVDARRAVNLAVDRSAAVAADGGNHAARATCHLIPPNTPGYRADCPRPDVTAARELVRRSGTRGARVTVWNAPRAFGFQTPVLVRTLRAIGFRPRVRTVTAQEYYSRESDSSTRTQGAVTGWFADYPSASTFLSSFTCTSLVPRSTDNSNYSQYCDPAADALMRRASASQATDPRAADALWARAERRVLAAAPAVPLVNPIDTELVSARVRNDQYHPEWGPLLDQLWVR